MAVYWAITDAGKTDLTFRLVDSQDMVDDESEPVFQITLSVESPNPLAVIEGAWSVKTILPKEGVYHCEMLAGDSILMSRRLIAVNLKGAPDDN